MILSRVKINPQERFDLEDFNAMEAACRSDSKLSIQSFYSANNLILGGFSVTGLGLTTGTVNMAGAALVIPQGTADFSYFIAPPSPTNLTIAPSQLADGVRNYVEVELATLDGVPLTKAFWDPEANGGLGSEFNQIVNTITDITVQPVISTGGFSGLPDRLPIATIDCDGLGVIKIILDRRTLFGRLATPSNLDNNFAWGSKLEPVYSLTMTSESGTFVAGEQISIGSETATVVTGGTSSITFNAPTGINYAVGSTVTGLTSGATGLVNTVSESFSGVDKSIQTQKQSNDAMQTEIKKVKGTRFWWQDAAMSLSGLNLNANSVITQASDGAHVSWDGSNLSISDNSGSPSSSDSIAYIRLFGSSQQLVLERQDGQGGSLVLPISDGQVLFVQLPASGNRSYSAAGPGSTNYQTASIASFAPSDTNYWLAFRDGTKLYFRGTGELDAGGSASIGASSGGSGGVTKATLLDALDTALPSGASATIDGQALANGNLVLFTNLSSGNNRVYKASGVGTSITWALTNPFEGHPDPSDGDLIVIQEGAAFGNQVGQFKDTAFQFNDMVRLFTGTDFWEMSSLKTSTLADNTTNGTVFSVTATGSENFVLFGSIKRNGVKETVQLLITSDGTNVEVVEGSAHTGTTGVSFSGAISGPNLILQYTTSSTGFPTTFKYWTSRWSDSPGGPSSIVSYAPFVATVNNAAFCMTDGSGVPIHCSNPTLVGGKTRVVLGFSYIVGANSGLTVGDLEVRVNGQAYPRFVSGSTLDGNYKEINATTVEFNTDLSVASPPLSIEIIKRV